jgi:hypothetical protein
MTRLGMTLCLGVLLMIGYTNWGGATQPGLPTIRIARQISPPYPNPRGFVGRVLVKLLVDSTGVPMMGSAVTSGLRDIDSIAVATAMQWRFETSLSEATWIATWIQFPPSPPDSLVRANVITPRLDSIPERLVFRLRYKTWSGTLAFACDEADWGWDSLTINARPGEGIAPMLGEGLVLETISSPREGLISYDRDAFSFPPQARGSNVIRIGTNWVPFSAAGFTLRLRVVPEGTPSRSAPISTTRIIGRLLDDSTSAPIPIGKVLVADTRVEARSDETGHFELVGVPVGDVVVRACGLCHEQRRVEVRTSPGSKKVLIVRMRRQPGCRDPW